MSHLYVPSGKYPSYAPVIFMLVLFITTGICGFIYGYYSTEFVMLTNRNTPGINPIASLIGIGLIGASHIVVIFLLIKKLKIRNPSLARRWAWCASAAGWSLNWLMGLYIASGSDFGLFHLIANRLANGVPGVVMLYQSSFGPPIFFWINGYILLLIMVFEALAIPLLLGLTTRGFASLAFSEKKEDWYKLPVELPFRIYKHPKSRKMILKGLETDYDWVEDSKLNLHYNMLGYPVTLFSLTILKIIFIVHFIALLYGLIGYLLHLQTPFGLSQWSRLKC